MLNRGSWEAFGALSSSNNYSMWHQRMILLSVSFVATEQGRNA